MRLLNLNIIKLAFCLIIGVIIGHYGYISFSKSIILTLFLTSSLCFSFLKSKNKFKKTIWFGLIAFVLSISIGLLITNLHNQKNFTLHYINKISIQKDSASTIRLRVREILTPTKYHDKYIIDIIGVDKHKTKGKAILNIKNDSTGSDLNIDEIYLVKTSLQNISPPLNPHQFNYKAYLEKQYIYHEINTPKSSLFKISSEIHTLFGLANTFRDFVCAKLTEYHFNTDELAIIKALILGQRQDVSKTMYSNYVNSGTIHVLAVSGLHVGILMVILSFIFQPLERFRYGKLSKALLIVILLWGYALITGLSASVTRSVTMFSIIAIAQNLKRPTNAYNTLAISLFIILLFKPLFIFDIGFQLSYLAVFAIITIDPIVYNLWQPKNKLVDYCWHTFTITLSAQLIIAPISLFYFHQFPGLFFISNMVVVPLSGLILGFGLLIIILASINLLPQSLAYVFSKTIDLMNDFVELISNQNAFVFRDIPFNSFHVIMSYTLIAFSFLFIIKKKKIYLTLMLLSIITFQCCYIYLKSINQKNTFVVFQKNQYSIIAHKTSKEIIYSSDFDSNVKSYENIIKDYALGNTTNTIKKTSFTALHMLNNKLLFVIDSLCVYNVKSFSPDYILLRQSPKINLSRLIDSIQPKHIIADGSNYKSYINYWESVCKKRKLPFHATRKKGAFIVEY